MDAYALQACMDAIETAVDGIVQNVNTDPDKAMSLTESLDVLTDMYEGIMTDLEADARCVNPRLHFNRYPDLRARIARCERRYDKAMGRLADTAGMQNELACIEDWANGELDFLG